MDNLFESKVKSTDENFAFLRRVNPALLTLYPLQLANVERVEKNDAVFVFDEVGCGKTISSGLMALSYLERHQEKKVLVITINSLVRTGQFRNDWFHRLPFTEEQKSRITVINDHVSKIQEAGKENWGLVIVDEAQLFLSDEITGKGMALKRLNSEKVVFLTATPIRKNEYDLEEYLRIASSILKKECVKVAGTAYPKAQWEEKVRAFLSDSVVGKEETGENICARFEPSVPVTRYFKDTVRYLEKAGDSNGEEVPFVPKSGSKRRFAMLWRVTDDSVGSISTREECLFAHIQSILEEDNKHHFVVFALKEQALKLGEYFSKKGFKDFYSRTNEDDKTYRVVTGDNSAEFGDFKGKDSANNPTVLFVNYQVAEQGLNLPGFDYVVNYQISQFPSRLEQRFGRIDRLDKSGNGLYDTIHVCYVLGSDFEKSTWNFWKAADAYLDSVIPFLPSRNMILTGEILAYLEGVSETINEKLSDIREKLKDGRALSEEEKSIIAQKVKSFDKEDDDDHEDECEAILNLTESEIVERWIAELERLQRKKAELAAVAKGSGLIKETEFSDEIFIIYGDKKQMRTITNVECAQAILQGEEYKRYCSLIDSLEEVHKVKELHERTVTHAINSYLCMAFALGDLNALYPLDGVKRGMKRILQIQTDQYMEMFNRIIKDKDIPEKENNSRRIRYHYFADALLYSMRKWEETGIKLGWDSVLELSEADKAFLVENAESFLERLPVYQYLREAGKALFELTKNRSENGNIHRLSTEAWTAEYSEWLTYFGEKYGEGVFYLRYYIEGEDGWEPSPFLKLFYHYERMESPYVLLEYGDNKKIYGVCYSREKECIDLLENLLDYLETDESETRDKKKDEIAKRLQIVEKLNEEITTYYSERKTSRCIESRFGQIFNESVSKRKKNWRVKRYDVADGNSSVLSSFEWYADNNNLLKGAILEDVLRMKCFKKKLDYWSYNLIREMLQVEDYFRLNPEIRKIYTNENPEYGFDYAATGISGEIPCETDKELVNRVLVAISPWLRGN